MNAKITKDCITYLQDRDYEWFAIFILNSIKQNKALQQQDKLIWSAESIEDYTVIKASDDEDRVLKEYKLSHHLPKAKIEVCYSGGVLKLNK